jgi:hypothetical protein
MSGNLIVATYEDVFANCNPKNLVLGAHPNQHSHWNVQVALITRDFFCRVCPEAFPSVLPPNSIPKAVSIETSKIVKYSGSPVSWCVNFTISSELRL